MTRPRPLPEALVSHPRRGAAAVEFALIVPILFALLVGVVDLSRLMIGAYDVQQAARDGAYVAANTTLGPGEDASRLEDVAVDQALAVLETAGWDCPGGVNARWYEDERTGYWVVRVDVVCPLDPLLARGWDQVGADFTMLTQQRGVTP